MTPTHTRTLSCRVPAALVDDLEEVRFNRSRRNQRRVSQRALIQEAVEALVAAELKGAKFVK